MTLAIDWQSLTEVSAYADRKAQRECRDYVVVMDMCFGNYKVVEPGFYPDDEVIYHRAEYKSPYD